MPIIDAHTHAFPDALAPGAIEALTREWVWQPAHAHHGGTVAALLASMDRAGIDQAIVCSVATRPGQVKKITDWSAAIASDRLLPFASIHPDFEDPEPEIERIAALGLRGIKFHPQYMNCPADDPRVLRIARCAERVGLAMNVHAGCDLAFPKDDLGAPRRLRALHDAVPHLRLLAPHAAGWQAWDEAFQYVVGRPIYLDTSYALAGQCPPELLHEILRRHPAEYLLFGSDSPWTDQSAELHEFLSLPLPDPVKRAALWENTLRFLNLSPS